MGLPLEETGTRRWVLFAAGAIAALLIWQAGEIELANHLIQSQSSAKIEHGIRLLPGNADAWDRLGRLRQWDLMDADPPAAINDYKRAVALEPTSPYYWMDLGSAFEDAGDFSSAREAFRHAEDIYPASADVAWHYGNFLLREGVANEGINEVAKAVRIDPSLLPEAVSTVWRAKRDVNLIVAEILPPNPISYFDAIDFFDSTHEADAALVIWQKVVALGKPFDLARSFPLIEELIRDDRSADTQRVWLGALQMTGKPHGMFPDHSVVWDGGFTEEFANGGLGWRWEPALGVSIDFDSPRQSASTRSVRVDFGGSTNLELYEPREYVAVEPNRTYLFRGYLRTERISTESGLRFSIVDPNHPTETSLVTENLTGTNGWTQVDAQVSTSPETHFLVIRVYRYPSRLFENKLTGTAWIADISLIPSAASQREAQR